MSSEVAVVPWGGISPSLPSGSDLPGESVRGLSSSTPVHQWEPWRAPQGASHLKQGRPSCLRAQAFGSLIFLPMRIKLAARSESLILSLASRPARAAFAARCTRACAHRRCKRMCVSRNCYAGLPPSRRGAMQASLRSPSKCAPALRAPRREPSLGLDCGDASCPVLRGAPIEMMPPRLYEVCMFSVPCAGGCLHNRFARFAARCCKRSGSRDVSRPPPHTPH